MTDTELIAALRLAAQQIADEGHAGWGNTCADAAIRLQQFEEELMEAKRALGSSPRTRTRDDGAGRRAPAADE